MRDAFASPIAQKTGIAIMVRLLIATTTWWPSVAVLASAFEQAGFDVVALCPRGHVALRATRFGVRELDRHRPAASLAATIREADPTIAVAGDERVVAHLRELHRADASLRPLIERSLGAPASHHLLVARADLLDVAVEVGFAVPRTRALRSGLDLEEWLEGRAPPWVLKVDGAWGGEGVRVAGSRETARRAFADLRRGMPVGMALKRRFLNGDPMPLQERRVAAPRQISVQRFIEGRPATCAIFASAGTVLGATCVEAATTCGDRGPATILHAVERPDIVAHARQLVRCLGLSGFIGLDFLIDRDETAWLIEMNPRITGASRMRTRFGLDPIGAAARLFGCRPRRPPPAPRDLFASFPLAWLDDPAARELLQCQDDLPWREPAMLRDALRPLWPERGLAFMPARLRAWHRRLVSGDIRPDHRLKPFSWWLTQSSMQVPRLQTAEEPALLPPLGGEGDRSLPHPT